MPAALLPAGEAVGKTRGVVERSSEASGKAVKLVTIWLSSVRPPASPLGPLELSTTNSHHDGFSRQPHAKGEARGLLVPSAQGHREAAGAVATKGSSVNPPLGDVVSDFPSSALSWRATPPDDD
jgi:hypothetical protein